MRPSTPSTGAFLLLHRRTSGFLFQSRRDVARQRYFEAEVKQRLLCEHDQAKLHIRQAYFAMQYRPARA
jgi:hypothetical protein